MTAIKMNDFFYRKISDLVETLINDIEKTHYKLNTQSFLFGYSIYGGFWYIRWDNSIDIENINKAREYLIHNNMKLVMRSYDEFWDSSNSKMHYFLFKERSMIKYIIDELNHYFIGTTNVS